MVSSIGSPIRAKVAESTRPERRFYRPAQVCHVTGDSASTVMRAIYSGDLEAYQRGRCWFVPVEAVDRWVRGDQQQVA